MPRLSFVCLLCASYSCFFTFLIPVSVRYAFVVCLALCCIAPWEPGRLFKHQALAIDAAVSGLHVALSTATSSGKSVVFNVSVLEAILGPRPEAVAIYLFPTKALAQDQLRCAWFLSLFARRIASMYRTFAAHSTCFSPAPRLASPLHGSALPSRYCRHRGLYDLSTSNVARPSVASRLLNFSKLPKKNQFFDFSFFIFFSYVHLKHRGLPSLYFQPTGGVNIGCRAHPPLSKRMMYSLR